MPIASACAVVWLRLRCCSRPNACLRPRASVITLVPRRPVRSPSAGGRGGRTQLACGPSPDGRDRARPRPCDGPHGPRRSSSPPPSQSRARTAARPRRTPARSARCPEIGARARSPHRRRIAQRANPTARPTPPPSASGEQRHRDVRLPRAHRPGQFVKETRGLPQIAVAKDEHRLAVPAARPFRSRGARRPCRDLPTPPHQRPRPPAEGRPDGQRGAPPLPITRSLRTTRAPASRAISGWRRWSRRRPPTPRRRERPARARRASPRYARPRCRR